MQPRACVQMPVSGKGCMRGGGVGSVVLSTPYSLSAGKKRLALLRAADPRWDYLCVLGRDQVGAVGQGS